MGRREDISSILVIGSGPIVIGQACEFDYSGTQACRVLREEGYRVVLVNSNPATIMTDPDLADATYVEPLDADVLAAIIARERPDALLPDAGRPDRAQPGDGALGARRARRASAWSSSGRTRRRSRTAEDRELFKEAMIEIGLECPDSGFAHDLDEALAIGEQIGFPIMVRPVVHPRRRRHRHRRRPGRAAAPRRRGPRRQPRLARSSSSARSRGGRSSSSR